MKRILASRTPKIHVSLSATATRTRYVWLALWLALCALAAASYLGYRLLDAEARIEALELQTLGPPERSGSPPPEEHEYDLDPAMLLEPYSEPPPADAGPELDDEAAPSDAMPEDTETPEDSEPLDRETPNPEEADSTARSAPASESPVARTATAERSTTTIDGVPALSPSGPWIINLVSYYREEDARRFLRKARALEVPAESVAITSGEKPVWRLTVSGFRSAAEATEYGEAVKGKLGLTSVWVSRD